MNAWLSLTVCTVFLAGAAEPEKGTVRFRPVGDAKSAPEQYRLEEHVFDYEMTSKAELPNSRVLRR